MLRRRNPVRSLVPADKKLMWGTRDNFVVSVPVSPYILDGVSISTDR